MSTSASELTSKIKNQIDRLAEATDAALASEAVCKFLETMAKFHSYSFYNQMLIVMQNPNATQVAGYHKWLSMHRWVKKGEKGIAILAPVFAKKEDQNGDEKKVVYFRVVYVFDVSQTDGEPLPEPPDWKSPAKQLELEKRLFKLAYDKGLVAVIEDLGGETQGMTDGEKVVIDPDAGTKTFIHELAHCELKHIGNHDLTHAEKELEAEAVAFIVGQHFGISDMQSPNYIALHGATGDDVRKHFNRIHDAAKKLICELEPAEEQELELV